jgi:hypothetical protein
LRNPIERILSEYFYCRNNPVDAQGNNLVSLAREHDLRAYVQFLCEKRDAAICNFYTRHLVQQISRRPLSESEKLYFAKEALSGYDFVGIQEQFVDSVDMFCCQFALPPVMEVPRINPTHFRKNAWEIDEWTRNRLVELNTLDLKLYEFALQAFHAKKRAIFHRAARADRTPAVTGDDLPAARRQSAPEQPPETFGNQLVRINSVSVVGADPLASAVRPGAVISILIEVAAKIDVPSLTVGLEISDELGEIVYGTNTHVLQASQAVRSGRRYVVRFTLAANLRDGRYNIAAALHTGNSHEECCFHWRDQAAFFDVASGFAADFVGYCRLAPSVDWRADP